MEYFRRYRSPLGGITLAADGEALTGRWFDGQKHFADTLDPEHRKADLEVFDRAVEWLRLYFGGEVPRFTPPLRLKGSLFRRTVWEILLAIPRGRTTTYGEIARTAAARLGVPCISAQAVGGAVGHNPVSLIVPCHRVIGASGSLIGYAGGIDRKKYLLALEGVEIGRRQSRVQG